jgi:REP element-mobilizing transposase RayT
LPALAQAESAASIRDQILQLASEFNVNVCAYTVMPDHVHLLLRDAHHSTQKFIWRWKQATGYGWRQAGHPHPLWQRGYHDHILRLDEDPKAIAVYILMNPVQAGLVERVGEHPFTGAPGFDNLSPVAAGLQTGRPRP